MVNPEKTCFRIETRNYSGKLVDSPASRDAAGGRSAAAAAFSRSRELIVRRSVSRESAGTKSAVLCTSNSYHRLLRYMPHNQRFFSRYAAPREQRNSALLTIFGASKPVPAIPCRQSQTAGAALARICQR
jgi:hypothetical protein